MVDKLVRRYLKNLKSINKYYNFLILKTKKNHRVGLINEYLINNFYLLLETKEQVLKTKILSNNYLLIKDIIVRQNYNIDFDILVEELKTIQKTDNKHFTYQELISIFPIIIIIYTEKLNNICVEEYQKIINREKANKIIKDNKELSLDNFITSNFDINNKNYIFEIIKQTKTTIIKELNKYLENKNISIKEIMDEEYQKSIDNNILILTIFDVLKEIKNYSLNELLTQISTDKDIELKEDGSRTSIKNRVIKRIEKCKNYEYDKEILEDDIRVFNKINPTPILNVLSNRNYSQILDDRGNSLNNNIFMFIKDIKRDYIFSNTYSPINTDPNKYRVVFSSDKAKYLRKDKDIITKTEIIICKNSNVEIRKIAFKNESSKDRVLELTSYVEPINDMIKKGFIKTEFDYKSNSLIAENKVSGKTINYMMTRLIIDNPQDKYSYETEKDNFIGIENNLSSAQALKKELSNYSGDNINPILALRNKILIPKNSLKIVYFIIGYGKSKRQINDIINNYDSKRKIQMAFRESELVSVLDNKISNITKENIENFNLMINYLCQSNRILQTEDRQNILRQNILTKSNLWKFELSGDKPIITIEIIDIDQFNFIYEILKAFEYFKKKLIFVDIIIINKTKDIDLINKIISNEIYYMNKLYGFSKLTGDIKILDNNDLNNEEKKLLDTVSIMKFIVDKNITLKELLDDYIKSHHIFDNEKILLEENEVSTKPKLDFDNEFGGFTNNGKEYVIYNKNTPLLWKNILANDKFKSIITNQGSISTYFNDEDFKLSSNFNNKKSEGFRFNGYEFVSEKCIHGFGYSILESETKDLKHEIIEFIPINDNVKIYLMKLKNKKNKKADITVEFWINSVLGNSKDTTRYLITEFIEKYNYLKIRNAYSIDYGDIDVIMTSSEKIKNVEYTSDLKKINTIVNLDKNEEKSIVFALGCSNNLEETINLINKYMDIDNCSKELKKVKEKWNNKINDIVIKTPDKSFNYMMNGWLLYQSLNAITNSINYKDKLQNAMNISKIDSELSKKIIIDCAAHQFIDGDVLHWWKEINHSGLRSNYKDDYLWLVYATTMYIETTNDYKILEEEVPYIDGEDLSTYDMNKEIIFNYLEGKEILLNHLIRSLDLAMNDLGSNKLPLIGSGDFCETMDQVGIKNKGESIWLGFFLYNTIDMFIKMMNKYDTKFDSSKYLKFNEKLENNLNKKAWDGSYYLRAFFDNGDKLGSNENKECKIDLATQSFAILSGIVSKVRMNKIIDSVEKELVDSENKIIKLFTPAFSKSLNNPGTIMNYPQGIKENGGQYTITVSWYLMALIKLGYYDMAYKYFQMINPINREIKSYKIEPYLISDSICSNRDFLNRGFSSWNTATASYFYKMGIEDILGLKIKGKKLEINPHIPSEWKKYEIKYKYLDTNYNIKIKKSLKSSVELDEKILKTKEIDLINDHQNHNIVINVHEENVK